MVIFWVFFAIFLLLVIVNFWLKSRLISRITDFLVFIQFIFLIIAISIKDPLFEAIGVPIGYEWVVGILVSGFGLWFYYLNPLKERVIETEKEIKVVKNDVSHIRNTTDKLEQKFFAV